MSCTRDAERHDPITCWTWPHAGKTPAWLDVAGSGSWHCKGAWPAWGIVLPHEVSESLANETISQKPRLFSLCLSPTPCQGLDTVNIILLQQARRQVIMHTVVDKVYSLVWGCLIAWNQHFSVCQSFSLTKRLLCCFTNHYGPTHRALLTKHGRGLQKVTCGIAEGRVLVHCLRHQASPLLEKINHIEFCEVLLPFLSPWELITALCPWLCGLQDESSSTPSSLHRRGKHAHCPRPPPHVSSWATAYFRNAITVSFTNCLWVISRGNFKIFS